MPHLAARKKKKQLQEGELCAWWLVWSSIGSALSPFAPWGPRPRPKPLPSPHTHTHNTQHTERHEAIARENRRLLGKMLTIMERDPAGHEAISGTCVCCKVCLNVCVCVHVPAEKEKGLI
jgi:hypothetical protein